jgi:hypothetical protein
MTNIKKQVVQGDGQKIWKDTKLGRGLSQKHSKVLGFVFEYFLAWTEESFPS